MITFWVDQPGAFGIRNYIAGRGATLRDRLAVRVYEWQAGILEVPGGPQIFAALDRLTPPEREAVRVLRAQLGNQLPTMPLLNDPDRCLLRLDLLHRLADLGINQFRAYRGDADFSSLRFPVFVRGALEHGGNLSGLLESPEELRRALLALRLRGYRRPELLLVEYCDTSDRQGIFRKYSAFRVGESIVPVHLLAGHDWMMKAGSAERTLELAQEDLRYVEQNPHQPWLREVFSLAGIEYGRIDYGMLAGRPQVWEINLNPTIGRAPGKPPRPAEPATAEIRERARDLAHARLREAFAALDRNGAEGAGTVALRLETGLQRRIAQASGRQRRRRAALDVLKRIYTDSPLGRPMRALLRRAFPLK